MYPATDIAASLMSPALKLVADKIRAGTAATVDVAAAPLDLAEKAILRATLDGTATLEMVRGALVSPALKAAILASPYLTLSAARATGAVGTVTPA